MFISVHTLWSNNSSRKKKQEKFTLISIDTLWSVVARKKNGKIYINIKSKFRHMFDNLCMYHISKMTIHVFLLKPPVLQ